MHVPHEKLLATYVRTYIVYYLENLTIIHMYIYYTDILNYVLHIAMVAYVATH